MSWGPPIKAQTIEGIIHYRRKMHEGHIAEALFGDPERVGEIKADLEWLVKQEFVKRNADGTYSPGRDGPSNLNKNEFVKKS